MHQYWNKTKVVADPHFKNNVLSIHLYDSIAFLKKGQPKPLTNIKRGTDLFYNSEKMLNPKGTYYEKG
jgi:hypothetical protein